MHFRKPWDWRGAVIAPFALWFGVAIASAADASGEVVPLAPLTVVDNRVAKLPPVDESWLYGRIGEFEVLSNASQRDTQDYMKKLYEFHLLFTELFPQMNVAKRRPATFVLCGNREAFRAIQPKEALEERNRSVSFSGIDENSALIALDLETRDLLLEPGADFSTNVGGTLLGDPEMTLDRQEVDPELQVKREYVRFVLSQADRRAPAWLEEGLAQLFAIIQLEEGTLRFGKLRRSQLSTVNSLGDSNISQVGKSEQVDDLGQFFNKHGFIGLQEFFTTASDSEEARSAVGGVFGMQALAFVHYSLFANNSAQQKAFTQWVTQLAKQPPTEQLFESCYGKSYKAFQVELRGYLQGGRYRSVKSRNFVLPPMPDLTLRDAAPAEWLRVKADAQRFAGRTADAALTLQAALENKYTDGRLYASVGFLQTTRENPDEALRAFRNATNAKVELPGPYLALAQERFESVGGAHTTAKLATADFVALMRLVIAARERMQAPRRDLYELAAAVWLRAPVAPQNANLALLEEGVLAFPSDVTLVADTAELKKRIGRRDDAHQLAQLGLRVAKDEAARTRFTALANETKPAGAPVPH